MALARVFAIDGVTLEMLDISGNALEEGGVAALAKALSASSGLTTVKLASHPLPIQVRVRDRVRDRVRVRARITVTVTVRANPHPNAKPLPIQALKTGARVDMDGQKLTDFDLQFMATVLSASRAGDGHLG